MSQKLASSLDSECHLFARKGTFADAQRNPKNFGMSQDVDNLVPSRGRTTSLYRGRRSDLLAANTMARLRANTESRASPISLGPILTQSDTNSPSLGLTTGRTAT